MKKVVAVQAFDDYKILVTYQSGEKRIKSMKPLLEKPVFAFLRNQKVFKSPRLVYGAVTWTDETGNDVDICPDQLYKTSSPVVKQS